jgi:predicted transcriptional regulator YheO
MLHGFLNHNNDKKNDLLVETYTNNSNEMIATAVSSAQLEVSNNPSITAPNRNKEIIYILNEKGIFQLKDAVVQVAHYLGITKNTVYLHLRNLSNNGVGNDEIKKV